MQIIEMVGNYTGRNCKQFFDGLNVLYIEKSFCTALILWTHLIGQRVNWCRKNLFVHNYYKKPLVAMSSSSEYMQYYFFIKRSFVAKDVYLDEPEFSLFNFR